MRAEVSPATAEQNALDRPWRAWVSVAVGTFVLVSLTLGLFILPSIEQAGVNPFATICRAIGIPGYQRATSAVIANSAAMPNSDVSWTAETLDFLQKSNPTRGAKLAQDTCAGCHGASGISPDPQQFPNLAAQMLATVFKELRDFQAGTRKSEIMAAVAQSLTRQQMADVAAYYASRAPAPRIVAEHAVSPPIARIARQGDPDRAIPSCDSCHGQSRSGPIGTPVLLGEPVPYLEEQLKMFASGARSNDLYARMRIVARQLTPDEMHGLATYYSGMVIGSGRAADRQKALDFGAHEFVDLENGVLEDVGGVDLAFDVIGGRIGTWSARSIRAGGTLVTTLWPAEARPADGLAVGFVVLPDHAQLSEIIQRVRDARPRTNVGDVSTLDKAVAALNRYKRINGKTIIRVRP